MTTYKMVSVTITNVLAFTKIVKYLGTLTKRAVICIDQHGCVITNTTNIGDITKVIIKIPSEVVTVDEPVSVLFDVSDMLASVVTIGKVSELKVTLEKNKINLTSQGTEQWDLAIRGESKKSSPKQTPLYSHTHTVSVAPKKMTDYTKRLGGTDEFISFGVDNENVVVSTKRGSIPIGETDAEDPLDIKIVSEMAVRISKASAFAHTLDMCFGNNAPVLYEYITKDTSLAVQVFLSICDM